jgi:hypothetical protein
MHKLSCGGGGNLSGRDLKPRERPQESWIKTPNFELGYFRDGNLFAPTSQGNHLGGRRQ